MADRITSTYLHELQSHYWYIGDRGIRIDMEGIKHGRQLIESLINDNLKIASDQWGCKVFIGKDNAPDKSDKTAVNLNATQGDRALLAKLKDLGYHVPKITKKNEEGEYESKYSTGELALQKMLAENQFKHPAGDPAIRSVLKIRELGKLKTGYFNSRFLPRSIEKGVVDFFFLCTYNCGGTLTGRRSSKRHTFNFGNNAQNFPKHSETAKLFRRCLVPRRGNIFLMVDQQTAEEWPVSALSANQLALTELRSGIDRHSKFASAIFNEHIPAKSDPAWNGKIHDIKRYLGKKVKHARNYGMKKKRMSESLAQEGYAVSEATCQMLLERAAAVDPSVDTVFHKYIQDCLSNEHMLITPFGRERLFLGCRPNADNNTLFNEAYAYIPQSTVGDNTGFAVCEIERNSLSRGYIVQEGHDSIVQDIPNNLDMLSSSLDWTIRSFDRDIVFHNGIKVNIPVEAEIGYDFEDTVTLKTLDRQGLVTALDKLNAKRESKLKELASV